MPRTSSYWTRHRELELIEFIRQRDYIWKPVGNTNHHIQQKYKAYAEFAAKLGRGFTARSVRDRWVNIRSTFNHNLRKMERSKNEASTSSDVYVPTWPLWKPLQFLRTAKSENGFEVYLMPEDLLIKEESHSEVEVFVRQRSEPTDKVPKKKTKNTSKKCIQVLDDLIHSMKPLVKNTYPNRKYWFFGKHVAERLNAMREIDAICAHKKIQALLTEYDKKCENRFKSENLDAT